jgi:hypothetical protein
MDQSDMTFSEARELPVAGCPVVTNHWLTRGTSPFLSTTGRAFLPVALPVAEDKTQNTNIYYYEGQPEQPDNLRP